MKQITNIRKAVCTMANELKKEGYTLSQAFRKAWRRIKLSMKIRAVGTTAGEHSGKTGIHETVSSRYHASRACKRTGKPI
ncbi:MAG: hypothetical protein ACLRH0_05330 [Blautia wexlerae]